MCLARYVLAGILALCAAPALAQSPKPDPEVGIRGGWMRLSSRSTFGDETFTAIVLPGSPPFVGGGVHAAFFASPQVALEPQLGFIRLSSEGGNFALTYLALQVNGFLAPDARRSPYVFAQLGTLREDESGGSSDSQIGIGGGVGYRRVYRESVSLRYEARYRRWSGREDFTTTEWALLIGLGVVLGRN